MRPGDTPSAAHADASLVAACRSGDRAARAALYHLYRVRVYHLVMRIGGPQDADELCQEVFLKVFRNIAKFRGESAVGTWIYRLAVNAALTHVTRRPRERMLDDMVGEEPCSTAPLRDPRLRERLEQALTQLPPGYRAVLVLHDVEGLSHEEIADILGCRVGTSKSQLHKARQKMRELLGPHLLREVHA